ncbi:MAG: hypothetical protein AABZ61_10690 [Bacteroidota bacterium]
MSPKDEPRESEAVAIEKERQRTKRYLVFVATFALLAVIGIFVVFRGSESGGKRTVDIDLKGGKISLSVDKPIVEQVNLSKSSYNSPQGKVEFTTGEVDPSVVKQISENEQVTPTAFVGKNFINQQARFLLTVDNPSHWQVTYNPEGLTNPLKPVNTIYTQDGSHLNVNLETTRGMNLEEYVTASLGALIAYGVLTEMPDVSYDEESGTAFLYYVNNITGGRSYQKLVLKGNTVYVATANYNEALSDPDRIKELIDMVATFSVVGT